MACSSSKKGFHQRRPYSISAALDEDDTNELQRNLRPAQIVEELNKYVVGQPDAKRAVAIALRNRWRRRQLPEDLRKEIVPRNVLLVGPTGKEFVRVGCRVGGLFRLPNEDQLAGEYFCISISLTATLTNFLHNAVLFFRMREDRGGQENGKAE